MVSFDTGVNGPAPIGILAAWTYYKQGYVEFDRPLSGLHWLQPLN